MELVLFCSIVLLFDYLPAALNNRWLRADPSSRLGLSIAFGTLVACVCGCIYLLLRTVRFLIAYLTA
jgi:hypothetical protein